MNKKARLFIFLMLCNILLRADDFSLEPDKESWTDNLTFTGKLYIGHQYVDRHLGAENGNEGLGPELFLGGRYEFNDSDSLTLLGILDQNSTRELREEPNRIYYGYYNKKFGKYDFKIGQFPWEGEFIARHNRFTTNRVRVTMFNENIDRFRNEVLQGINISRISYFNKVSMKITAHAYYEKRMFDLTSSAPKEEGEVIPFGLIRLSNEENWYFQFGYLKAQDYDSWGAGFTYDTKNNYSLTMQYFIVDFNGQNQSGLRTDQILVLGIPTPLDTYLTEFKAAALQAMISKKINFSKPDRSLTPSISARAAMLKSKGVLSNGIFTIPFDAGRTDKFGNPWDFRAELTYSHSKNYHFSAAYDFSKSTSVRNTYKNRIGAAFIFRF